MEKKLLQFIAIVTVNITLYIAVIGAMLSYNVNDNASQNKLKATGDESLPAGWSVDYSYYYGNFRDESRDRDDDAPHFLPIVKDKRRAYDDCIVKRDSGVFRNRKYLNTEYWIFYSNHKCLTDNFRVYTYAFDNTEISLVATTADFTIIQDLPDKVNLIHIGGRGRQPIWLMPNSIESIVKYIAESDTIKPAIFDNSGIVDSIRSEPWRCSFRKTYRSDGFELSSLDGETKFNVFVKYPFRFKATKNRKRILERYKKTPPFVFFEISDFYCYFSNIGCHGTHDVDFSAYDE